MHRDLVRQALNVAEDEAGHRREHTVRHSPRQQYQRDSAAWRRPGTITAMAVPRPIPTVDTGCAGASARAGSGCETATSMNDLLGDPVHPAVARVRKHPKGRKE